MAGRQSVSIQTVSSRIEGRAKKSPGLFWQESNPSLGEMQHAAAAGRCVCAGKAPEKYCSCNYVKGSSEGLH